MNRCCTVIIVFGCLCQSAFADPESLERAKQALVQIEEMGRSPSFSEFVDLVNREDILLTEVECFELRRVVGTLQEPEISREVLAERIATKREMIKDYVACVSVEEVGAFKQPLRRFDLAGSGERSFSREWLIDENGQETMRRMTSFDGEFVRQHNGEANWSFTAALNDRYRMDLIRPAVNPIGYSMLLDTKADLGADYYVDVDLTTVLETDGTIVFAERQEVDGHLCLVVDRVSTVAYLDPELDFSVVRREAWYYHDEGGGQYRPDESFTSHSDFRKCDGGFLFAMTETVHDPKKDRETVITVDKLVINGGVEESVFQGRPDETRAFEIPDEGEPVERD